MDVCTEVWSQVDSAGRLLGFLPKYGLIWPLDQPRDQLGIDTNIHQSILEGLASQATNRGHNVTEIMLVTTLTCPASCTYCYAEKVKSKQYLSAEDALKALWTLDSTPKQVSIFGGEPFIQPEKLDELLTGIRPALHPEAEINIATGLLYSDRIWEAAKAICQKHRVEVSVTIDCPDDGTAYTRGKNREGDIAREVAMVRELRAAGIPVVVSSAVTPTTRKPCSFLRTLVEEMGVDLPTGLILLKVMDKSQILSPGDLIVLEQDLTDFLAWKHAEGHPIGSYFRPITRIYEQRSAWKVGGVLCPSNHTAMSIMPDGGIAGCFFDVKMGAPQFKPDAETAAAWRAESNPICASCEMENACPSQCPQSVPRGTPEDCAGLSRAVMRPMMKHILSTWEPETIDTIIAQQPFALELAP